MHKLVKLFSVLSLVLVFTVVAANAQTVTKIDADIPFAFSVGNTDLAPGKYSIKVVSSTAGTVSVRIAQKDGSGQWTALGLVNSDAAIGESVLVFDRYGNDRVLRQVKLSDSGISIGANRSRKVRLARNEKPVTETVAIASN
jgi:hypothetical protein